MSPEQVAGDVADLDTRSDVYALGVIVYELLAGRLPFDVGRKSLPEAARMIREEEPTRLSSVARGLPTDVETIVAKALEKDKLRRYGSAAELAEDIRRFLRGGADRRPSSRARRTRFVSLPAVTRPWSARRLPSSSRSSRASSRVPGRRSGLESRAAGRGARERRSGRKGESGSGHEVPDGNAVVGQPFAGAGTRGDRS